MREVDHTIHDILDTIARVESKVAGKDFEEFQGDWEFRFVLQRALEVVSEATRRLPDELKADRPEYIGGVSRRSEIFLGMNTTRFRTGWYGTPCIGIFPR